MVVCRSGDGWLAERVNGRMDRGRLDKALMTSSRLYKLVSNPAVIGSELVRLQSEVINPTRLALDIG